jgi:hypothetical protein
MNTTKLIVIGVALLGMVACQPSTDSKQADAVTAAAKNAQQSKLTSPGKPSAPVSIDYKVLGTPLVGQPLAVEIRIAANEPGQSMRLKYFINDADSLMFADSQPESIDVKIAADEPVAARQVRLVPQREGRLYLNVTAELETADGMMLKSIAVPISVGSNAVRIELNGAMKKAADGETVISLPAVEN